MAARTPPKKGAAPKMKTLVLPLEEPLHRLLKTRASEQGSTIKNFVTKLLERELKGEKK